MSAFFREFRQTLSICKSLKLARSSSISRPCEASSHEPFQRLDLSLIRLGPAIVLISVLPALGPRREGGSLRGAELDENHVALLRTGVLQIVHKSLATTKSLTV
jgi:hypothetical protein